MKKVIAISLLLLTAIGYGFQHIKTNPAAEFLNSLDDEQRQKAHFSFDDLSRSSWHYLPGAFWPRSGIWLHELTANQKELIFKLLKNSLSETGYKKTQKIIDLENVLAEMSGNTTFRDPEKYNVAFYGIPEKDSLWAWSFEGHHLSLHFTHSRDNVSILPRFLGANPAIIKSGKRKGERTLDKEDDFGLNLINSMSSLQREKAIFQKIAYLDIVTSNSTEVGPLRAVGIKMQELNDNQQSILLDLITEYLSTIPKKLAVLRMKSIKEDYGEIRFGWAGALELGKAHYYRIQGTSFLVEFDNTQNDANHIHTVWRDFDGDFGRDLIREHYQESHHH